MDNQLPKRFKANCADGVQATFYVPPLIVVAGWWSDNKARPRYVLNGEDLLPFDLVLQDSNLCYWLIEATYDPKAGGYTYVADMRVANEVLSDLEHYSLGSPQIYKTLDKLTGARSVGEIPNLELMQIRNHYLQTLLFRANAVHRKGVSSLRENRVIDAGSLYILIEYTFRALKRLDLEDRADWEIVKQIQLASNTLRQHVPPTKIPELDPVFSGEDTIVLCKQALDNLHNAINLLTNRLQSIGDSCRDELGTRFEREELEVVPDEPETENVEPKTENVEPKTENSETETESSETKTENSETKTKPDDVDADEIIELDQRELVDLLMAAVDPQEPNIKMLSDLVNAITPDSSEKVELTIEKIRSARDAYGSKYLGVAGSSVGAAAYCLRQFGLSQSNAITALIGLEVLSKNASSEESVGEIWFRQCS
jgi:hypothetical protein